MDIDVSRKPDGTAWLLTDLLGRAMGYIVQGGEKTIQWSACVCAGAGGVKVGHWIG